jgi:prolyl oligopeptidase
MDVDALAAAEGVPWAFGGTTCLPPEYTRCLMRLSRGGADAVEVREFDMGTLVRRGRVLPARGEAERGLGDGDALLVATDFGEGA